MKEKSVKSKEIIEVVSATCGLKVQSNNKIWINPDCANPEHEIKLKEIVKRLDLEKGDQVELEIIDIKGRAYFTKIELLGKAESDDDVPKKEMKQVTPDQKETLEFKIKNSDMEILKLKKQLAGIDWEIENNFANKVLKFQKEALEASIDLTQRGVDDIKKVIEKGFKKPQQASDTIDEKKVAKELPGKSIHKKKD